MWGGCGMKESFQKRRMVWDCCPNRDEEKLWQVANCRGMRWKVSKSWGKVCELLPNRDERYYGKLSIVEG